MFAALFFIVVPFALFFGFFLVYSAGFHGIGDQDFNKGGLHATIASESASAAQAKQRDTHGAGPTHQTPAGRSTRHH